MRVVLAALFAVALAACGAPPAATTAAPPPNATSASSVLELTDAWAAPTPGGATVAAGYLTIANHGAEADRLIGVSSPRAQMADVHRMSMDNGMMQMRPAGALEIPAGGSVSLAPGGLHLMFMGVTAPFAEGESVPVTLRFEHAGDKEIILPVRRGATSH